MILTETNFVLVLYTVSLDFMKGCVVFEFIVQLLLKDIRRRQKLTTDFFQTF